MASDDKRPLVLSRETLLPLGAVLALVGTLLWAVWSAASGLARIERSIEARPTRDEVRDMLKERNGWSTEDMRLWIRLFRAQEPALKIPDAK